MSTSSKPVTNQIPFNLFDILSQERKMVALVKLAKLACEQLPAAVFFDEHEDDSDAETDVKVAALLKQSIPWGNAIQDHVGDYWHDVLDRALGDSNDSWSQALGGWEGSEEWLTESLMESTLFYSHEHPGYEPDWGTEVIQGFLDDWRANFYANLVSATQRSTKEAK